MSTSQADPIASQNCSIARTLAVVGERWTLLVVRELALGRRRFSEIRENLGISTNILSDRLGALVDAGLVERTRVPVRGQVHDYSLTAAGADLLPVLVALSQWGDRHAGTSRGAPRRWHHVECEHETDPSLLCSHCGEPIQPGSLRVVPGPGASPQQLAEGMLPAPA